MWIVLVLGLSACSSSLEFDDSKQEKLLSFLIVENKLYVVGELHDYEFENQQVNELNTFLKSQIANKIKSVEANFRVKNSSNVEGEYRIQLDGERLSENERNKAVNDFKFTSNQNPYITYRADGKLVKLGNRNELLHQFRFKDPIDATVRYYKTRSGLQNTAEGVLGVIILPVAVVAVLPMYMFWVGACAIYGC